MNTAGRPLHHKILAGLVLGVLAGLGGKQLALAAPGTAPALEFLRDGLFYPVGQVFLRLLFLVVVPLVFASIAVGVAGLGDVRQLGRLGARTLGFFFLTTAFSAVLGLFLMGYFKPGAGFDEAIRAELMTAYAGDMQKVQTKAAETGLTGTLGVVTQALDAFLPRNILGAITSMQMLPAIVFALLFGVALTGLAPEKRLAMVQWLESVAEAMVAIVGFAMKLAPYAVFCLIYGVIARFGLDILEKLAFYVLLVLGAYLLQLFAFYPLLIALLVRRPVVDFLRRCVPVMVTALSTSSSSATLPTSLRIAQSELGVRPSTAGFVLPLGATMNMNGTALFEGAVVLFLAQVFQVELSLAQQLQVVLMCVFTAIGAAGVPGGSLPLLMIVLAQVGIPPEGIAIVLGVDRILDMGRTVVNVMGDLVGAAYVDRLA